MIPATCSSCILPPLVALTRVTNWHVVMVSLSDIPFYSLPVCLIFPWWMLAVTPCKGAHTAWKQAAVHRLNIDQNLVAFQWCLLDQSSCATHLLSTGPCCNALSQNPLCPVCLASVPRIILVCSLYPLCKTQQHVWLTVHLTWHTAHLDFQAKGWHVTNDQHFNRAY